MSDYRSLALDDEDDYAYDEEHIDLEPELGIYGPDDDEDEELEMESEMTNPLEPVVAPAAQPAVGEPAAAVPVEVPAAAVRRLV